MATIDRQKEIEIFLESLINQSYKNYELIIVDQNEDDRIDKICRSYNANINIIKSTIKGLSINRNIGLKYASGDIIAFPDDDCEYNSDTLEKVLHFFTDNPEYSFYTCKTKEKYSERSILSNTSGDAVISLNNIMSVGISFTIFVRAENIQNFKFDEHLGIGTEFGSGEETDLLLYLLKNKHKGKYHSQDYIYHPFKPETIEKAYQYGKGYGAIHKKAIIFYGFYRFYIYFLITIFRETKNILFYPYSSERVSAIRGRIYGFFHYKYKSKRLYCVKNSNQR
jgi:glycosyltransferase involved in cell wall biosynthesis